MGSWDGRWVPCSLAEQEFHRLLLFLHLLCYTHPELQGPKLQGFQQTDGALRIDPIFLTLDHKSLLLRLKSTGPWYGTRLQESCRKWENSSCWTRVPHQKHRQVGLEHF